MKYFVQCSSAKTMDTMQSLSTTSVFKYNRHELLQIKDSIKGKVKYKTLHPLAVANIRKYRIFKRLSRGEGNKRRETNKRRFENRQACSENLLPIRRGDRTYTQLTIIKWQCLHQTCNQFPVGRLSANWHSSRIQFRSVYPNRNMVKVGSG